MHSKHFLLYSCIFYFFLSLFFYFVFWPYHIACGILVPWQEWNLWPSYHHHSPNPLQWKYGVLTTRPPGKSPGFILLRGPFFFFKWMNLWFCNGALMVNLWENGIRVSLLKSLSFLCLSASRNFMTKQISQRMWTFILKSS